MSLITVFIILNTIHIWFRYKKLHIIIIICIITVIIVLKTLILLIKITSSSLVLKSFLRDCGIVFILLFAILPSLSILYWNFFFLFSFSMSFLFYFFFFFFREYSFYSWYCQRIQSSLESIQININILIKIIGKINKKRMTK